MSRSQPQSSSNPIFNRICHIRIVLHLVKVEVAVNDAVSTPMSVIYTAMTGLWPSSAGL